MLDEKYFVDFPFWDNLKKEEKKELQTYSYLRHFDAGSIIHTQDSECLGVVKVLSGDVRIYMVSEEGKEVTLYHVGSEEVDVLSASCVVNQITFDTQMIAKEESDLLIIPVTILSKYKEENIYIRSFIYEILADRFSDVMWTMQQILFLKIDQRIASYLLDTANKTKSLELHMTHEQITEEINSAREVVARMMKHFQEDQILSMKRGVITIKNKDQLLQMIG